MFIHTQLLDTTGDYYDNDIATITVNSSSAYSSISLFTTKGGAITSVVWNATTVG